MNAKQRDSGGRGRRWGGVEVVADQSVPVEPALVSPTASRQSGEKGNSVHRSLPERVSSGSGVPLVRQASKMRRMPRPQASISTTVRRGVVGRGGLIWTSPLLWSLMGGDAPAITQSVPLGKGWHFSGPFPRECSLRHTSACAATVPVVQWIEQRFPKPLIRVRVPAGALFFAGVVLLCSDQRSGLFANPDWNPGGVSASGSEVESRRGRLHRWL